MQGTGKDWFTVGIEEEYFLTDRALQFLILDPPEFVFDECKKRLGRSVTREFLRSQIEVSTHPHAAMGPLRTELAQLRRTVIDVAATHGFAPVAAGTHPFGNWDDTLTTDKARYRGIFDEVRAVGHRSLTCGMHVHVGIPNDEARIDLMNRVMPFLPVLLALSTSSPFWYGEATGLKSYRLAVYDEWPRTGMPARFADYRDYLAYVATLKSCGIIADPTTLWWMIRPSASFPTLELRIMDVCTRFSDAIRIASLYRCLLRMLWRRPEMNRDDRSYARLLIEDSRWRAQRYGFENGILDTATNAVVPGEAYLRTILDLVREDAEALGCTEEVEGVLAIHRRGTSADAQIRVFEGVTRRGADRKSALRAVVAWLARETASGVYRASSAASAKEGERRRATTNGPVPKDGVFGLVSPAPQRAAAGEQG